MKFAHISKHSSTTASATTGCYIKKKYYIQTLILATLVTKCWSATFQHYVNTHGSKQSSYYVQLAHIHTMQTSSHGTDTHCFFTAEFGQTFELEHWWLEGPLHSKKHVGQTRMCKQAKVFFFFFKLSQVFKKFICKACNENGPCALAAQNGAVNSSFKQLGGWHWTAITTTVFLKTC